MQLYLKIIGYNNTHYMLLAYVYTLFICKNGFVGLLT